MPTYSALTTLTGEDPARALGEAMERMEPEPYGVGVFEVEDGSGIWEVGGYFHDAPDEIVLEILATAFGAKSFLVSELPEVDWVAKVQRELHPVDAGRFFVYGSHDADKLPAGRIPLQVEATMAFGTGHHGTTLGCLLAFDRLYTEGLRPQNIADIGCGTAVLAMAALWPLLGWIALPLHLWLWGFARLAIVLVAGFLANIVGLFGAGDAKFAAAMAPVFVGGDIRLIAALYAACSLAAFAAHRAMKHTPAFRAATPDWKSWTSKKFPMGLALAGMLLFYLLAAFLPKG